MKTGRIVMVCAFVLLTGASAMYGAESRTHFVAMRAERVPVYRATLITNLTEVESRRTLLLENMHGERLVITNLRSYADQTDVYSFEDGTGMKIFGASIAFPLQARTRKETLSELRNIQTSGRATNLSLELRAGKGTHRTTEASLKDKAEAARIRRELRRDLPPGFVAEIARAKSLLSAPEQSYFCMVLGVLEEGVCARDNALRVAYTTPDCTFDASFGRACSPAQESRAATATATLKVGSY